MSEPLTPQQESRVQELVRAMLPEIIQAVLAAIRAGLDRDLSGR